MMVTSSVAAVASVRPRFRLRFRPEQSAPVGERPAAPDEEGARLAGNRLGADPVHVGLELTFGVQRRRDRLDRRRAGQIPHRRRVQGPRPVARLAPPGQQQPDGFGVSLGGCQFVKPGQAFDLAATDAARGYGRTSTATGDGPRPWGHRPTTAQRGGVPGARGTNFGKAIKRSTRRRGLERGRSPGCNDRVDQRRRTPLYAGAASESRASLRR
jgi:hypothetical protein